MIIQPVRDALEYYRRLNEAAQANKHRKSQDVGLNSSGLVHVSNNNSGTNEGSSNAAGPNNGSTPNTSSTVGSTSTTTTVAIRASSCSSAHETSLEGDNSSSSSNLCGTKIPSDPCNVNRVSRSNSVSMPNSNSAVGSTCSGMDPNNRTNNNNNHNNPAVSMNPIAIAHRRASQLLVRGGSGSITSLRSAMTVRSGPGGHFTSFPSLESDSEREGGDSDDDEDDDNPITEVAVSEKALKFKIATESSFDFSTSRKSSRENKSESSGQSGSVHSQILSVKDEAAAAAMRAIGENPQQVSFLGTREGSMCSLAAATSAGVVTSPTSCCSETNPPTIITTPQASLAASTGVASSLGGSAAKGKAKDSFFAKLKLFTERLSMGAVSGGSGGSTSGSPPLTTTPGPSSHKSHTQGFNYFRRSGARKKQEGILLDERPSTVSALMAARPFSMKQQHHRGSTSDPEGRDEFRRRHHTIHHAPGHFGSEGEQNNSELVSPECSPALSRSSAGGEHFSGGDDEQRGSSSSSWKQCSGSLDSILSKDDANKKSPGRKLVLPRFSFHKTRTRMGFMRRLSPNKGGSESQQQQQQQPES